MVSQSATKRFRGILPCPLAWRVDFNLSLSSFEPAIRGVRHIIDLALGSLHPTPPRVMFTSSVGNVKGMLSVLKRLILLTSSFQ